MWHLIQCREFHRYNPYLTASENFDPAADASAAVQSHTNILIFRRIKWATKCAQQTLIRYFFFVSYPNVQLASKVPLHT